MADIAFLLLVFFLVTTVFPKDRGLSLTLPHEDSPVDVPPVNILQFLISEDGRVEVRRGAATLGETVDPSQVARIWREGFAENDRLVALVRTHPSAHYQAMIDVLRGLTEARANRISLQVLR